MELKKLALTLALSSCLVTSAWASSTDILSEKDKILSAKLTMAKDAMKVQHDSWWNDFEFSSFRKTGDITAYMNQLADKDPEAATWFLAGAKYGFVNRECTPAELENLRSTKKKVIEAEIKSIQNGASGFLKDVKVSFDTGHLVIEDLLNRVKVLEKNNTTLNADILNLKNDNKALMLRLDKVEKDLEAERKDRKAERDDFLKRLNDAEKNAKEREKAAREETEKAIKKRMDDAKTEALEREEAHKNEMLALQGNFFDRVENLERRAEQAERDAEVSKAKEEALKQQLEIKDAVFEVKTQLGNMTFERNYLQNKLNNLKTKHKNSEKTLLDKIKNLEVEVLKKDLIINDLNQKISELNQRVNG